MNVNEDFSLRVENLKKYFAVRESFFSHISERHKTKYVKAVDDVSFRVSKGEIFGLIGESGCGKTTTAKLVMSLLKPTSGHIYYQGRDLTRLAKKELRKSRLMLQMIFQDPYSSLSPWLTTYKAIAEPLEVNKLVASEEEKRRKVKEIMGMTGLEPVETIMSKYPHELSGGQRQRVGIARALVLNPMFIVADEPVSMIDVSLRLNILNLILDMRKEFGFSGLFITHDIAVARYMCNRIGVMYLGKIVEVAPTNVLIGKSLHPYMKALVKAVPTLNPERGFNDLPIKGDISLFMDLPSGCVFYPRCPYAIDICERVNPPVTEIYKGHFVACHLHSC